MKLFSWWRGTWAWAFMVPYSASEHLRLRKPGVYQELSSVRHEIVGS